MRVPDGWITLEEAAPIVGVSSRTLRKYASRGRFPTVDRIGHARIVPRADLVLVMTSVDGDGLERSVIVEATNVLDRLTGEAEAGALHARSLLKEIVMLRAAYERFHRARSAARAREAA